MLILVLMTVIVLCDVLIHRIPNRLVLLLFAALVLALWLAPNAIPSPGWSQSFFGLLGAGLILLPGWRLGLMGAGDVKLAAALGFALGWPLVIPLLLGFGLLLGVWCAVAWLLGRRDRQPAAPAMALAYVGVLWLHLGVA